MWKDVEICLVYKGIHTLYTVISTVTTLKYMDVYINWYFGLPPGKFSLDRSNIQNPIYLIVPYCTILYYTSGALQSSPPSTYLNVVTVWLVHVSPDSWGFQIVDISGLIIHNPDIFPLNGHLQELQQIFHFGKLTGQRGPPLFALLAVSQFGPKEWVPNGTWYTSNQAVGIIFIHFPHGRGHF